MGKLNTNWDMEFAIELVALETKDSKTDPISLENPSDVNKLGNKPLRGVTKSIF